MSKTIRQAGRESRTDGCRMRVRNLTRRELREIERLTAGGYEFRTTSGKV